MIPLHNPNRLLLLDLFIIFAITVIATILFWEILPTGLRQSDSSDYPAYYEPVARNILQGKGFVFSNNSPAIGYPPGYPLLLAGVFGLAHLTGLPEFLMHSIFVLLCIGISSVILFLFSSNVWGNRYAWLTSTLFITYPFILWLTKQPNSEIPFMVFLYGSIYLFWLGNKSEKSSGIFYTFSGILAGIAMLIRPIAVGLGILLACFVLFSQQPSFRYRLLSAFIILLSNILIITPWQIWINSQSEQPVLLSTGSLPSIRDGLTFAVNSQKNYRVDILLSADVITLQKELLSELPTMKSLGEIVKDLGQHFISEPYTTIKLFVIKAIRSWYATDSGRLEVPTLIVQAFYLIIIGASFILVYKSHSELRSLLFLETVVVFYFWAMTLMALSILRYMTPALGLLFILVPAVLELIHYKIHVTLQKN